MQLHVNGLPTSVQEMCLTFAIRTLDRWNSDWMTAEWWEDGKCIVRAMRIPSEGTDVMVLIAYTTYPPNGAMFADVKLVNVNAQSDQFLLDGYEVY